MRWTPFWSVFHKEFLHLWRDRPSLAMAAGIPLMMLLIFGYGVNPDVRRLPMSVWDQCRSAESREMMQAFVNTTYFEIKETVEGYGEVNRSLADGRSRVALIIPPDFAANMQTGRLATLQVLIDGTDPQSTRQALTMAQSLVQARGARLLQAKESTILPSFPLDARIRIWYNQELKTHFFTIPALIGLIMQNVTMTLTAFALVREKERGTLEQLIVTPVRPAELILGKLCPYIIVGMLSFTLVLIAGSAWFSVPIRGSLCLLFGLAFLFILTSLSIGMLMSTFSENQLQAMQMAFAFILPSILLSGFVFPRETMPASIRLLGNFIPLTDFLVILRGVFLKESGMGELYREVLSLAAFTVFLFVVALMRFRKRLD